jgi:hypothetical protein
VKLEIEIFLSTETTKFFDRFNFDFNFLQKDTSTWNDDKAYQTALKVVNKLHVVNYAAERGIKLIENYICLRKMRNKNNYYCK